MGLWAREKREGCARRERGKQRFFFLALGHDKRRKLPFKIMYVFCLSCPSATFALQHGGFVPREWPAAKGLFFTDVV